MYICIGYPPTNTDLYDVLYQCDNNRIKTKENKIARRSPLEKYSVQARIVEEEVNMLFCPKLFKHKIK